jgi:hypothetical protein
MRIPYRQRWLLWHINHRLGRSDPHLAAMLEIFARLYLGEVITSVEQAGPHRLRCWLTRLSRMAVITAVVLARAVHGACSAVRRRFRGSSSSPAYN